VESPELKAKYRYVLDGISQIPSLPTVVSKILGIINNPRAGADDIAKYLEMDVGLAGKILRLANSAYYGVPGGITSVNRAVVQLGFNAVSSIVVSASVFSLFKSSSGHHSMNRVAFWRHSIETALYCRVLARLAEHLDAEIAFTQGMLHDIGALALETAFPAEYSGLIESARKTGTPLEICERELFGMDHGQVGSRLLERWGIPEIVRIPVAEHHGYNNSSPYLPYTQILELANDISQSKGSLLFVSQTIASFDLQSRLARVGISVTTEAFAALCEEEMKRAQLVMNLLRS